VAGQTGENVPGGMYQADCTLTYDPPQKEWMPVVLMQARLFFRCILRLKEVI